MTHDPLCLLSEPCGPDEPSHGYCLQLETWCIHCERECICERLAKARADERERSFYERHDIMPPQIDFFEKKPKRGQR